MPSMTRSTSLRLAVGTIKSSGWPSILLTAFSTYRCILRRGATSRALLDPGPGQCQCTDRLRSSGCPVGQADTVDVQWRHFEAPTLCWWPSTMRSGHRPRTQHGDGHGDSLVRGLRWGPDWPSRRLTEEIQCARMTALDQQGQIWGQSQTWDCGGCEADDSAAHSTECLCKETVADIHREAQSHIGHHWVPQAVHGRRTSTVSSTAPTTPEHRPTVTDYWTEQWQHGTDWMMAFFKNEAPDLVREYRVSTYFGEGIKMDIVTDASPWGIGGYLVIVDKLAS